MSSEDEAVTRAKRLRLLLKRCPQDPVDYNGVILDYLGQTHERLVDVFDLNHAVYSGFFVEQDVDSARRLIECLIQSHSDAAELIETCQEKYPRVRDIVMEILPGSSEVPVLEPAKMNAKPGILAELLAQSADPGTVVVWQLSDIHFGKLNKLEDRPRDLAFLVAKVSADFEALIPDVVLVSGDLTSVAAAEEFEKFCTFCKTLGAALWGSHHPSRVLVVPGNHDVTWNTDGTADQLAGFADHVAAQEVCITPFGNEHVDYPDDEVGVRRANCNSDTVPPLACVTYNRHEIEFVLLVSSYFSGAVPKEVRDVLESEDITEEKLLNLLREDRGAVNSEYLYHLAKLPELQGRIRIAVTHHNPVQYGVETCQNKYAPQLLEVLRSKDIPIVLHGHCHLIESEKPERLAQSTMAFPVPCTTLCSTCTARGKGMSIHVVSTSGEQQKMETYVWELSEKGSFTEDGLSRRYTMIAEGAEVRVDHSHA